MPVIETDLLIAALFEKEKHHSEATTQIRTLKPLKPSPYTLIEIDLLVNFSRIRVKDVSVFYTLLEEMLKFYSISIVEPSPFHMKIVFELRERYGMTYFDSLRAAVAMSEERHTSKR